MDTDHTSPPPPSRPTPPDTWNGGSANAWVTLADVLDELFRPIELQLTAAAAAHPGARVLDVGCGSGATTVAAARAVGPQGHATGLDVAEPMIQAARARAAREQVAAEFVIGDAQTHPLPAASFDLLLSRFGVMFFDDPVAAFTNLRRAASPGAQLQAITWRTPAENPFMTTAERAATHLLPDLPERRAGEPGQFGLAEADAIEAILLAAGWITPQLERLDVTCTMPADQLEPYVTLLGPVGMALRTATDDQRAQLVPAVLDAFAPYVDGAVVRFTAACWTVRATAPPESRNVRR